MTISVTVFSDYICPFCYIGSRRLLRLADEFDLDILWANIEIHPETPYEGMPVEDLGYPSNQWQIMMSALTDMARDEGLQFAERQFTTNSHRALLLAEAAKDHGAFACVHEALFHGFFAERHNIGDREILRAIATDCGMTDEQIDDAWASKSYRDRLRQHHAAAAQAGVSGTPTFVIGHRVLSGAVEADELRKAIVDAQEE